MKMDEGTFAILCDGHVVPSIGQFPDQPSAEAWIEMAGKVGLRYEVVKVVATRDPEAQPEHNF